MIVGTIATHEEPAKYKYEPPPALPMYPTKYHDHWYNRRSFPSMDERDRMLKQQLTIAEARGFEVGTKVRRTGKNNLIGTIISISNSSFVAWDMNCSEMQPFRVEWEGRNADSGEYIKPFSFNYKEEDLEKADQIISDIQHID